MRPRKVNPPKAGPGRCVAAQGHRSRDRGYAMVLVLIAVGIATIVSLSMLSSLTPAAVLASNTRGSADALAVAVSGLDAVEAYVLDDSQDWVDAQGQKYEGAWFTDAALGAGTYTITAERTDGDSGVGNEAFQSGDAVTFTSTANVDGVTAIARRTVAAVASAAPATPTIQAGGEITLESSSVIDSYDSGDGAYSGGSANAIIASNTTQSDKIRVEGTVNGDVYCGVGGDPNSVIDVSGGTVTGSTGALTTALDTGTPAAPSGFPGGSSDWEASNDTLGSDGASTQFTYMNILVKKNKSLTIRGDVGIHVKDTLKLEQGGDIVLASGATLTLYASKKLEMEKHATVNNDSARTADLVIYLYDSSGELVMEQGADIAGFLHAGGKATLKKQANFYGRMIVGDELKLETQARFHADEGLTPP